MGYSARVVADSVSHGGDRLTTLEVEFPRMVLAEFNTHRVFSRNSASSRAIPVPRQLARVMNDPFVPEYWGANQPGMQAEREIPVVERERAKELWLHQRDMAVMATCAMMGGVDIIAQDKTIKQTPGLVERLHALHEMYREASRLYVALDTPLHKQVANRTLEPFMWHTVVVTSTEWDNFFALRDHPNAQPEIKSAAQKMREALLDSTPKMIEQGEWHLPFIQEDEVDIPLVDKIKMAVGRSARVSYLTHDGHRAPEKDIELHDSLLQDGHMSPFEHVARPMSEEEIDLSPWSGNFRGWHQYRKEIQFEDNYGAVLDAETLG